MIARRAGFVLAGGGSTRMGRDKALLPYRGVTLLEYVASQVEAAAGSVALVGPPERYAGFGYPTHPDLRPRAGPLGGLETALRNSEAEWSLVVACDMPGLTTDFLARLLARAEASGAACLLPVSPDGHPQPLCAAWSRRCLEPVAAALSSGVRKMADAAARLAPALWPVNDASWFENLNTPADWDAHRARPKP
jgi:molybdopterin-guanine dinucleotide biosynthesis protein A